MGLTNISADQWPALISGSGVVFGLVLLAEALLDLFRPGPPHPSFYIGVVTSLPLILGLIYGGYWLTASELPPDRYGPTGRWWIAGLISTVLIIFPINATIRPITPKMVVATVRWSGALGGAIGLLVGVFHARSIHRAVQAERARQRRRKLQQERDRLDQFASTISHDLRNPLHAAQGRLELAQQDCESDHLEAVKAAHDQMAAMIDDLLTLARVGDTIEEPEPVDLAALSDSSWQHIETTETSLRIETDQTIQADWRRLQQLLENLFRNAVEHGAPETVTVGELDAGFYIADDGTGIPADEREQVFEAGYSTAEEGTGFGLNIVREIAEAHGWEIRVTDSEAGGARFEITGVEFAE